MKIVDLPNLEMVIFHSYVSLPEGMFVGLLPHEYELVRSIYQKLSHEFSHFSGNGN